MITKEFFEKKETRIFLKKKNVKLHTGNKIKVFIEIYHNIHERIQQQLARMEVEFVC